MIRNVILIALVPVVLSEVSHILSSTTTLEPEQPPRPYAFGYAAGRFPGHIDRTHSEISDGAGTVKGSYSYVDPRHQIRTVDYVADKEGFHPILNKAPPPLPADLPVVAAAKERHLQQYAAIANAHHTAPGSVVSPADSVAVQKAKLKHLDLYQQIAAEHARVTAEREAQEAAEKAIEAQHQPTYAQSKF